MSKTDTGAGRCSVDRLVRLPARHFTYNNCSRAYGQFVLDLRDGKLVGKPGWKIVGYGKAPYPNDGDDLALMLEKTEQPDEGERIWHHCARLMFEDTWGKLNESSSATATTAGVERKGDNGKS